MARLKDSRPKGENDTKRETPIVQFPLNQETACELFAPDAKAALEKVAKEDTSASYTRTDSNTVCLRQPRSEGDGISWARPIWIARQIKPGGEGASAADGRFRYAKLFSYCVSGCGRARPGRPTQVRPHPSLAAPAKIACGPFYAHECARSCALAQKKCAPSETPGHVTGGIDYSEESAAFPSCAGNGITLLATSRFTACCLCSGARWA